MVCIDDEIPFEIPKRWCWARMFTVIDVRDGTHDTPSYVTEGYPLITGKDFYNGFFCLSKTQYISAYDYDIIKQRSKVDVGDILFSMIGGNIGSQILITEDNYFEMAIKNVALFKQYGECFINSKFLSYFLQSRVNDFKSIAAGGAQSFVSLKQLRQYLIPIPSFSEQARIVSQIESITPIINRYEKAQDLLEKTNKELLDRLKRSILQDAIQGKLVSQDPNDEPAAILLGRIKEEKLRLVKEGKLKKNDFVDSVIYKGDDNKYYEKKNGEKIDISDELPFEIPDLWAWARLGFITSNEAGLSYNKECLNDKTRPFVRVLRGGNIEEGRWFTREDDVMISNKYVKDSLLLKKGTFITPAVTSIERMAKTALIEVDQKDIVIGGFMLMIKPFMLATSFLNYLNLFFQTTYYKQYCISITNKSGQAFYNLSRQKLMQCFVPIPPLEEQRRIVERFSLMSL